MADGTPKSAVLPYPPRRYGRSEEEEDDDDSGCMLDEYGWAPVGSDTVHNYFNGPADSIDATAMRLSRQLPPQDANPSRCRALADAGEVAQLRAFAAQRRRHCLGRGVLVGPDGGRPAAQKVYCHQCKEPIGADEITVAAPTHFEGSPEEAGTGSIRPQPTRWHARCFVCVECRELLVDFIYFHHSQNVFCGRHHAELLKPRCGACDELIFSEECAEAEGRAWHLTHFGCTACGRPLAGQRYVTSASPAGQPLCLPCHERRAIGRATEQAPCSSCARSMHAVQSQCNWQTDSRCLTCSSCSNNLLGRRQYRLQPTPPRLPPPPPPPIDANNNEPAIEKGAENIYETVMTAPAAQIAPTTRLQTFSSPSAASASSAYSSRASGVTTGGGTSSSPSAASASSLQRRRLEMEARQRVAMRQTIRTRLGSEQVTCGSPAVCRSEVCFGSTVRNAEQSSQTAREARSTRLLVSALSSARHRRIKRPIRVDSSAESSSASTTSCDEVEDGALDEYLSRLALAMRLAQRPADSLSSVPKKACSVDGAHRRRRRRPSAEDWRQAAFARLRVDKTAKLNRAPEAVNSPIINVYSEMPPEKENEFVVRRRHHRRHKHRQSRRRYVSSTTTSDASDQEEKLQGRINGGTGARSCVEFATRPAPPFVPPLHLQSWAHAAKVYPTGGHSLYHRPIVSSRSSQDLAIRRRQPPPPTATTAPVAQKFSTARLARPKAPAGSNCIVS